MQEHSLAQDLAAALERATREDPAEALLLSGGVDSAVIAALHPDVPAITVGLIRDSASLPEICSTCNTLSKRLACGGDLAAAERVTTFLRQPWHPVATPPKVALVALDDVMRLLGSYDLGLLNTLTIFLGLRLAQAQGWRRIWTGDAADEFFAGYRFLRDTPDWHGYLTHAVATLRQQGTDATRLGQAMGMHVTTPYLHPAVTDIALALAFQDSVAMRPGDLPGAFMDQFDPVVMASPEKPWGKAPLRAIAATVLPLEIAWRPKMDMMFGAGMCQLEHTLAQSLTAEDRAACDTSGRHFWNDAHRALFTRFQRLGIAVSPPGIREYPCAWCGAGVTAGTRHCLVCGASPADVTP